MVGLERPDPSWGAGIEIAGDNKDSVKGARLARIATLTFFELAVHA